ncbi:MAG: hypothetical protein COB85_09335 [Bacteroidetes bacterium]|nr:MAG: hypothetical protein COB85_09335 [Bacteroidota bacterium]
MKRFYLNIFSLCCILLSATVSPHVSAQTEGPFPDDPPLIKFNTPDPEAALLGEQKVGLVLSGGGARGLAHIGVIKALEEYNIPIDYITGTSMGAIIGGMYAVGLTPAQMEYMVKSDEFTTLAKGGLDQRFKFYFKKSDQNASWITLKMAQDSIASTSLPTSLINSVAIDFMFMEMSARAEAAANYDFDNLFVPFRCVAADIVSKKQVIFSEGHLNEAIRASATFPFYLKPITVNGKLLFDGGMYNNFPSDVMLDEFYPDLIIGSNVSGSVAPPTSGDVISQIKNMLIQRPDAAVICENGILIEPDNDAGTFAFSNTQAIIDSGYSATIAKMPEILKTIKRRVSDEEMREKRRKYQDNLPELIFDNVHVLGLDKSQTNYVERIFKTKNSEHQTLEDIKPVYFRVFEDDKIGTIFPIAEYNENTGLYDLYLTIEKAKEITIDLGGNISNRPISGAYLGLKYNYLGYLSMSFSANGYIGKLYTSAQVKSRIDLPIKLPIFLEPHFTYNRWDYFRSSMDFFDNETPSYLVQKEKFGGLELGFPVKNEGRVRLGSSYANLRDDYYQTKEFTKLDTADRTDFNVFTSHIDYERNTLNRKQYANEGSYFALKARYNVGDEFETPGTTSESRDHLNKYHEWLQFKLVSDTYYKNKGTLRLGFYFEMVFSTQSLFNNYTASILRAPAFQPNPESKTLFLESFRAHQYAAFGQKVIFNIKKDIDLRIEGYIFQPYKSIIKQDTTFTLGDEFGEFYTIATASVVYHSPIGPISLSMNYYHNSPEIAPEDHAPLTFFFHFGYIIFNRRALD